MCNILRKTCIAAQMVLKYLIGFNATIQNTHI